MNIARNTARDEVVLESASNPSTPLLLLPPLGGTAGIPPRSSLIRRPGSGGMILHGENRIHGLLHGPCDLRYRQQAIKRFLDPPEDPARDAEAEHRHHPGPNSSEGERGPMIRWCGVERNGPIPEGFKDPVRNVAPRITWYQVEAENEENIHALVRHP